MKFPVAAEISQQYLKLAVGNPQKIGQSKLFDCIVEDISSLSDEQITKIIKDALQKWKFKPKSFLICLPRNLVTVRNLHLPSQDKKEITQMLDLHISRIVPYRKEEIVFGHQFIGMDEMSYSKEILAIVHSDTARRQLKILESAGVSLDDIILSSHGLWQWIVSSCKQEINNTDIYLLLDFDTTFVDFVVFNRENLLFSRNIALDLKVELTKTEIDKFVAELKQSLLIFQNEEIKKKPAKIFISGAPVAASLDKTIESELSIPAKFVTPPYLKEAEKILNTTLLNNVSLTAVTELIIESLSKRISFVLPEMQIKKSLREKTKELVIFGTLAIYLFSVILAFFWGRSHNQEVYYESLNARYKLIEQDVGGLILQSKKVEFVRDFLYSRKIPLAFLYELQKLVPSEISISFISIDEPKKVTLRGQGFQLSDVFKFITTLENSKFFSDAQTKYTRTKRVKDKEVTDFEINFQIEPLK